MNFEKSVGLRTTCDDCPLYVSAAKGKEKDEGIIAELGAIMLMREVHLDEADNMSQEKRTQMLREYKLSLWIMEHETYKGDHASFIAKLKQYQEESEANINPFQTPPGISIFDQLIGERAALYQANVRKKYRDKLIDTVDDQGCEGPGVKRTGFLGRKVIDICQAPITEVEKKLAGNPPFNSSTQ